MFPHDASRNNEIAEVQELVSHPCGTCLPSLPGATLFQGEKAIGKEPNSSFSILGFWKSCFA